MERMRPEKLAKMDSGIVEEYPHRNRGTELVAAWPGRAAGHAHVRNSRGTPSPESNRRKAQSKTDSVVLPEALNVHRDLEHPVENVEAIFLGLPPCSGADGGAPGLVHPPHGVVSSQERTWDGDDEAREPWLEGDLGEAGTDPPQR
jgi:hypothetical protein